MKRYAMFIAGSMLGMSSLAGAQTTSLQVTVGPEASLTVNTSTTPLSSVSTTFANPYTGTTNLTYLIRTSKSTGSGSVTLKITSDFAGTGGPSVATPPSTGDALAYTCTVSAPGAGCTGSQTSSTAASTPLATFGAAATSAKAGNSASVAWSLTDDPVYAPGSYSATATFAISAL